MHELVSRPVLAIAARVSPRLRKHTPEVHAIIQGSRQGNICDSSYAKRLVIASDIEFINRSSSCSTA